MKYINIESEELIDYSKFREQILNFHVNFENLSIIIPYLASKFTESEFEIMQINLKVSEDGDDLPKINKKKLK